MPGSARPDSRVKVVPRRSSVDSSEAEVIKSSVDLRGARSIDPLAGKNIHTEQTERGQERCMEDELDILVQQAKERFK